jgi:hypothetical protein
VRKITFTGLAALSMVLGGVIPAGAATGPANGNAAAPLNGVWDGESWKLIRLP